MKDINKIWLKEDIKKECLIKELKRLKEEIIKCSETYKNVFNGSPFYENWDLESSMEVINDYLNDKATILVSEYLNKMIGFLVAINKVPENQQEYVKYLKQIIFIEEIGVLNEFRNKRIASEMVRILLLDYLNKDTKYIGYRTNAMRYFDFNKSESFESLAMKVQKEDQIKRMNNEKIIIPELSDNEKQKFINKYIELIQNRPDLDVSNSNALFRNIFGLINYNQLNGNYTFQKDPTGEGNDRIFPYIDLTKTLYLKK